MKDYEEEPFKSTEATPSKTELQLQFLDTIYFINEYLINPLELSNWEKSSYLYYNLRQGTCPHVSFPCLTMPQISKPSCSEIKRLYIFISGSIL
jgi:hypothetical protein